MNNNNVLDLKPTKPEVKDNIKVMKHYYSDNIIAIRRHLKNMIETYGVNNLNAVLNDINKDGL